jgi:hypothetical protein
MKRRDHLFQPGESGNPAGRPKGARNKSTMAAEMLLENQAAAITKKCVSMAMQGDITAIKLCLSRLLPIKRERTILLDMPPMEGSKDALRAIGTVLEAVGRGAITPGEGTAVARLLEVRRAAFEVEVLERRLDLLENQLCDER